MMITTATKKEFTLPHDNHKWAYCYGALVGNFCRVQHEVEWAEQTGRKTISIDALKDILEAVEAVKEAMDKANKHLTSPST
jgi:hypothetical protein